MVFYYRIIHILIISLLYHYYYSKILDLCFLYLFYTSNNMISFLYVAKQLLSVRHILTYLHVLLIILLHLNLLIKYSITFHSNLLLYRLLWHVLLNLIILCVALQLVSLDTYFSLSLLKLPFIFSNLSFSFKIAINSS